MGAPPVASTQAGCFVSQVSPMVFIRFAITAAPLLAKGF